MPTPTTPAATLRAAILREAATLLVDHASTLEALSTSDYDNESFAANHLRTKAVDLHCLADEAQQPEIAEQEPVQLRWGLDDLMLGDDDTTTLMLSGPDGAPYWLELDPERAAALRDSLSGPEATEAHRPATEFIGEVLEGDGMWMYLGADPDRAVAERRCASVTRRHPDAETRLVRKTTTYTVEPTGPVAHLPAGTNAEDCPACKGTNPPYPFLCPGPDAPAADEEPTSCTSAVAGSAFAPAGHYADCPDAPSS